jgi:hypothetical protein
MKTCTVCRSSKPLSEFHRDSKSKDGRRPDCADCHNALERGDRTRRTVEERFLSFVEKSDGCWIWRGTKYRTGYGQFRLNRRLWAAHRASYTLFVGQIPRGHVVRHKCDVPSCVNPDHLELGLYEDNLADMVARGRVKGGFGDRQKVTRQNKPREEQP